MINQNMGFGTKAIHGGAGNADPYKALNVPIYQNATFRFDDCRQGGNRFAGAEDGYIYTRMGNPTTATAENHMALLEDMEAGLAFSSGMGASAAVFWTACHAGAHIVADKTIYGCTFALLSHGMSKYGVEVTFVDLSDPENLKKSLRKNTVMVFFETPANPTLKVVDIRSITDIAHQFNEKILVVCDSSFATPYLQQPGALGCDVVVHSATKYISGHGDVLAGFACGKKAFINEVRSFGLKDMTGAVLGPIDAFLVMRGLKTLELRMERHCDNAQAIAEYLEAHPKISKVYYPGLASHINHDVAKAQMRRFGGMVSFEVCGGKEAAIKLLDSLQLCVLAVSLGDTETLIEHPASMTHSAYSEEALVASGISGGLIRMSAGLENIDDILEDLGAGLAKI